MVLTCLYGLITGASIALLEATRFHTLTLIAPMIFASILVIAYWTVFGPTRFWTSFLVGQILGMFIAMLCALGFMFVFGVEIGSEWSKYIIVGLTTVPTATVAAQVPLWIFRGLFGWRITYRQEPSTFSLTLRDLFLITFVIALALAVPQYAASFFADEYTKDIKVGGESLTRVPGPNGIDSFDQTTITAANISEIRAAKRAESISIASGIAIGCSIWIAIASLISVPLVWFVLGMKNRIVGWTCVFGYGAFFFILSGTIYTVINGFRFFINQVSMSSIMLVSISLASIVLPLAVSRFVGFRLTTHREREQARKSQAVL